MTNKAEKTVKQALPLNKLLPVTHVIGLSRKIVCLWRKKGKEFTSCTTLKCVLVCNWISWWKKLI